MRTTEYLAEAELGPLCSKIGSGITPRGGESVYLDEGVALIRSQNVYNNEFDYRGLAHINEDQAEKMNGVIVESGDVLLNITGDSVARCCIAPDNVLPARVNQHVSIIRPDSDKLDPRFLMYFLVSPYMQSYMLSLAGSGGTRKALTKGMIEKFKVHLPKTIIQKKIVGILSAYDDLIENNRRRIQLLEESARLLYKEWFVYLRFPGHKHVKIINGVPKKWIRATLGEQITLNYGKALKADDRIEGKYVVYGSSGIIGTHNKALVNAPGIIVGRKGNVGRVFWVSKDYWPIDTVYYISGNQCYYYLFHALQYMNFVSSDAAVPGLNRDFAYSRPYFIPPRTLFEQFEEIVTPIYQHIVRLEEQNEKLTQARDLILLRLMKGELAV